MDYRCAHCGRDLAASKPARSLIARMDVDCPHCMGRLQVNVHRAETLIVLGSVAGCVALAALAYARQNQVLLLTALGGGMAGAAALYILERTWLRAWRRFRARAPSRGME
jgi:DNA-directed RNA polymerase subunit RPC12/RpoP